MNFLTLETTCDETAAAIVTDEVRVLSSVIASQESLHEKFNGVVPEIAARAHMERILPVIDEALDRAGLTLNEIDAHCRGESTWLVGFLAGRTFCGQGIGIGDRYSVDWNQSSARPHLCLQDCGTKRNFSVPRIHRQWWSY